MQLVLIITAIYLAAEAAVAIVWSGQLRIWYAQAARGLRVLVAGVILVIAIMVEG